MKKVSFALSLVLFLLLFSAAGCNLPGRSTALATLPPTAMPTLEPAALATSQPEPAVGGIDPCLLGVWVMDVYDLDMKFGALVESGYLSVSAGNATLTFDEMGSFTTFNLMTIRNEIPDTSDYMEWDGNSEFSGSYYAENNVLTVVVVDSHTEFTSARSFIRGEMTEMEIPPEAQPILPGSPPAYSDYRCSAAQLELSYEGPSGVITETWRK